MKRRATGENVERFRRRDVANRAATLRDSAAEWAAFYLDDLRDARPEIPDELDDRAADGWEPLLAIADAVGGDWPTWARDAARELSAGREAEDDTLGVRLLADCRNVFLGDRIPSADLAARLAAIEDAPWGAWHGGAFDSRALARLLRPYGIKPRQIRFADGHNRRGYERCDFADAWARYCPPKKDDDHDDDRNSRDGSIPPEQPLQPLQSRSEAISLPLQAPVTNGLGTPSDQPCSGVAVKTAETSDTGSECDSRP